ncbi:protein of unknown function [Blastococcus saxobsidens DD2]|uniref:Uncharacterized protein n=1 Tax=Blastococcus saxobsidens (strain DD2) TaxID=1146883 RepID=H6RNH6_BLASD|nr:protein of unknown function [Blastococcus saxobsidens DD2]
MGFPSLGGPSPAGTSDRASGPARHVHGHATTRTGMTPPRGAARQVHTEDGRGTAHVMRRARETHGDAGDVTEGLPDQHRIERLHPELHRRPVRRDAGPRPGRLQVLNR